MVILAQVRLPPVVTAAVFAAIITVSVAAGTTPPTHVAAVPHAPPAATLVLVVAIVIAPSATISRVIMRIKVILLMIHLHKDVAIKFTESIYRIENRQESRENRNFKTTVNYVSSTEITVIIYQTLPNYADFNL
jgi:hypothetical protein